MTKQLEAFKSFLEKFAAKHQNDIRKNHEFRQHFQKMCARIGVDPLACKKSNFTVSFIIGAVFYEFTCKLVHKF